MNFQACLWSYSVFLVPLQGSSYIKWPLHPCSSQLIPSSIAPDLPLPSSQPLWQLLAHFETDLSHLLFTVKLPQGVPSTLLYQSHHPETFHYQTPLKLVNSALGLVFIASPVQCHKGVLQVGGTHRPSLGLSLVQVFFFALLN